MATPAPPTARRAGLPRRFARCARAVVGIEFAAILPVLCLMMFGTVEVGRYLQASSQVVQVVNMIGQMVSQLPASTPSSEVQNIWGAAPLIAPMAAASAKALSLGTWDKALDVTITNVVFTREDESCKQDCEYKANVAWSVGPNPATCGVLAKVSDDSHVAAGTVPETLYGEGSAISVTALLKNAPLVKTGFIPSNLITQSAWFRPRYTAQVKLKDPKTSATGVRICPGFQ